MTGRPKSPLLRLLGRAVVVLCAVAVTSSLDLLAAAASGQGQEREGGEARERKAELEERRARWLAKSTEERATLQRRYERLRRLPAERREELERRARGLVHLRETASEELRRDLDRLPPEKRSKRWHEHVLRRTREKGRRLREELPPSFRRRLESASPEKRRKLLEGLREQHDRKSRHALRYLGARLELGRERVAELEALPLERRLEVLLTLRRRVVEEGVAQHGLPPVLRPEEWEEIQRIEDDAEFFRRIHAEGLDVRLGRGGPPSKGPRPEPRREPRRRGP